MQFPARTRKDAAERVQTVAGPPARRLSRLELNVCGALSTVSGSGFWGPLPLERCNMMARGPHSFLLSLTHSRGHQATPLALENPNASTVCRVRPAMHLARRPEELMDLTAVIRSTLDAQKQPSRPPSRQIDTQDGADKP